MQPVDYTTLAAVCSELRAQWLPARCEQVVQWELTTLALGLRTLDQRGWLVLCWHPQGARIHMGEGPPKGQDTFTFSQQLKHQLGSLALTAIVPLAPWERALDLQFAKRPGDPVQWHLYVEIMGKYSNVILANAHNQIVTAAHQVSDQQSRVRPIQTGDPYQPPPSLLGPTPSLAEPQERWQERLILVPQPLKKALLSSYSGLSTSLLRSLAAAAEVDLTTPTDQISPLAWNRLFAVWQQWLQRLETADFTPGFTASGYTVLGWGITTPAPSIQDLLRQYYGRELGRQQFERDKNQLQQKLTTWLGKLQQKEATFCQRLTQSAGADDLRQRADLLMAYSHQWQPGTTRLTVTEFETGTPITIPLDPDKTAIQQAQKLYKQHQKLRRAKDAVAPLLAEVRQELAYLQQVDAALEQLDRFRHPDDLTALADIRGELIQQGYLPAADHRGGQPRSSKPSETQFRQHHTPSGQAVLVGRNNRQNDLLISTIATDYDLWFHTQEIPGSHVLLRLSPGDVPSEQDLQHVANLAAYFSRAREADQVPVVYTAPRHVFKPKGARPGMVIYKHETVLWGQPRMAEAALKSHADGPID